jgi:methionine-rich copper-binding protein CopC
MQPETHPTRGKRPRAATRSAPSGRGSGFWTVLLAACAGLSAAALRAPEARAVFHTALQATFPAADSVYREEVREVRLRYSTPVQLVLSTVAVVGADGAAVPTGPLEMVPARRSLPRSRAESTRCAGRPRARTVTR